MIRYHQSLTKFLYGAVTTSIALSKFMGLAYTSKNIRTKRLNISILKQRITIRQKLTGYIIGYLGIVSKCFVTLVKDFEIRENMDEIVEQLFLQAIKIKRDKELLIGN